MLPCGRAGQICVAVEVGGTAAAGKDIELGQITSKQLSLQPPLEMGMLTVTALTEGFYILVLPSELGTMHLYHR